MNKTRTSTIQLQGDFFRHIVEAEEAFEDLKRKISTKKIHSLRLALRRIRTVLDLLESNNIQTLTESEQERLKVIWKALGRQRDADVARDIAKTLSIDLAAVKKERKKVKSKTLEVMNEAGFEKVFAKLKSLASLMAELDVNPSALIEKWQDKLQNDFTSSSENLHEFRILLKKVRYLLEFFGIKNDSFKDYQATFGFLNDLKSFDHTFKNHKAVEGARKHQLKICKKALPAAMKQAQIELRRLHHKTKRHLP